MQGKGKARCKTVKAHMRQSRTESGSYWGADPVGLRGRGLAHVGCISSTLPDPTLEEIERYNAQSQCSHADDERLLENADRLRSPRFRGTSLIRNTPPVGPYSSLMPRDLW